MKIVTWVLSGTESIDPGYEQLDIDAELDRGGLVPIASGTGHDAAISIRRRGALLWGARLSAGETVAVPDERHAHVFAPRGSATLDGVGPLFTGDAVRLTGAGPPTSTSRSRRCRSIDLGNDVTS